MSNTYPVRHSSPVKQIASEDALAITGDSCRLSVEEFKALIAEVVDEQIRLWLLRKQFMDKRRFKEIFDSIDRHRITLPPGTPSTLEMLREDRDR